MSELSSMVAELERAGYFRRGVAGNALKFLAGVYFGTLDILTRLFDQEED